MMEVTQKALELKEVDELIKGMEKELKDYKALRDETNRELASLMVDCLLYTSSRICPILSSPTETDSLS